MRQLGVVALAVMAACSYTYNRPPITTAMVSPSCTNPRPAIDTAVGTTLALPGIYLGLTGLDSGEVGPTALGAALIASGAIFYASAVHGLRDNERCDAELVAVANTNPEPLHIEGPVVAMTCEQRRLDMYSRAVTGVDQEQRVRLLTELPSCEEPTSRERAWALTRMASLDAGAGKCDDIEQIAREVFAIDVVLHDVVLMGDIEIKNCLIQRVL